MPINIPEHLPVRENLREERIFVMDESRASAQDIRPLNIVILNLMPEKEKAELQLLRLLGNTPLQINVTFLHTATHESKHVSKSHLDTFYSEFADIKAHKFDGMIINGAPVEHLAFEDVSYWEELQTIMDWSDEHVTSVLHICWGAQAALYHHYGIDKYSLEEKCFGIFEHNLSDPRIKLVRGFDDMYHAPHSRHTAVSVAEIEQDPRLMLLSQSPDAGAFMIMSEDTRHIMITGHLEYEAMTLGEEYQRDLAKGLHIKMPENYYPNNDPRKQPLNTWRSHAQLLFSNWLNHYVYQATPYEWK